MPRLAARWLLLAALPALLSGDPQDVPQRPPTFRTSTELVLIDTQVVQRDGTPIQGLAAHQFEVFIDGRRRPVVSAEFIPAHQRAIATGAASEASGESAAPAGRTIVLAIDQNSFPVSGQTSAREAATRVVNSVTAEDSLGMIAFPGPIAIPPTGDRAAVREAVSRLSGLRVDPMSSKFNVSASEASQLKSRDGVATGEIIGRECRFDPFNPSCSQEVIHSSRGRCVRHQPPTCSPFRSSRRTATARTTSSASP